MPDGRDADQAAHAATAELGPALPAGVSSRPPVSRQANTTQPPTEPGG